MLLNSNPWMTSKLKVVTFMPHLVGEESYGLSWPPSPAGSANPVDVADSGGRKVVIDDEVDAFEVDAPAEELGANQDPDLA